MGGQLCAIIVDRIGWLPHRNSHLPLSVDCLEGFLVLMPWVTCDIKRKCRRGVVNFSAGVLMKGVVDESGRVCFGRESPEQMGISSVSVHHAPRVSGHSPCKLTYSRLVGVAQCKWVCPKWVSIKITQREWVWPKFVNIAQCEWASPHASGHVQSL